MYRVCIEKTTGKFIEMQSGGRSENKELEAMRLDTLKQNALNAGYKENEIEVKWVTDEEWAVIQATLNQPTPEQIAAQERKTLIQAKMRAMAEAELIKAGLLTA